MFLNVSIYIQNDPDLNTNTLRIPKFIGCTYLIGLERADWAS